MASFEIPGESSGRAPDTEPPPNGARTAESTDAPARGDRSNRRFTGSRVMGAAERERVLTEARDVDFPISLRGYDRPTVDRYVERVTRLITELEMSSSPEAAVRHALDEVSEETRDILQRAYQTADEIAARSRAQADTRLEQAEQEAQEMLEVAQREAQELRETTTGEVQNLRETSQRETDDLRERAAHEIAELRDTAAREAHEMRASAQRESDEMRGTARREAETMLEGAEARTRELARDAETIWRERRRLIDDMRGVGEQLVALGEVEGKRFPHPLDEQLLGSERPDERGSPGIDERAAAQEPVSSDTQA